AFLVHAIDRLDPDVDDEPDAVEDLEQAIADCQATGNTFVEAVCMVEIGDPLIERGDPGDAAVLRATIQRLHAIRYDFGLQIVVTGTAVWLVRVGRPDVAGVVVGYLDAHVAATHAAVLQPNLERIDRLLDRSAYHTELARGRAMTLTELTDHLDDELG